MPVRKNVGVRLPAPWVEDLEAIAVSRETTLSEIVTEAIANYLGVSVNDVNPVSPFKVLSDRISRLEMQIMGNYPSEDALQASSDELAVRLDVQPHQDDKEAFIGIFEVGDYTDSDGMIICPSCGGIDSDWIDEAERRIFCVCGAEFIMR